jgi:hypothetical protein
MDVSDKMMLAARSIRDELGMEEGQMAAAAKELDEEGRIRIFGRDQANAAVLRENTDSSTSRPVAAWPRSSPTNPASGASTRCQQTPEEVNRGMAESMQTPAMQKSIGDRRRDRGEAGTGPAISGDGHDDGMGAGGADRAGHRRPPRSADPKDGGFHGRSWDHGTSEGDDRKLQAMTVRKAIDYYGADFQHPALEDRKVTETETYAGVRGFQLPAGGKRRRNGDSGAGVPAGPGRWGRTLRCRRVRSTCLATLPGPAQVGQSAVHILGQMFPGIARMAENTEP